MIGDAFTCSVVAGNARRDQGNIDVDKSNVGYSHRK